MFQSQPRRFTFATCNLRILDAAKKAFRYVCLLNLALFLHLHQNMCHSSHQQQLDWLTRHGAHTCSTKDCLSSQLSCMHMELSFLETKLRFVIAANSKTHISNYFALVALCVGPGFICTDWSRHERYKLGVPWLMGCCRICTVDSRVLPVQ